MGVKEFLRRRQAPFTQSVEAQEMLPSATEEVADQCANYQIARLIGTQSRVGESWEEIAQKFPPFSEKIGGLRRALESSDVIEDEYREAITGGMILFLAGIKDEVARSLFVDLLSARVKDSLGDPDCVKKIFNEAKTMVEELGFQNILGEEMKTITCNDVIRAVLTGSLSLPK